MGAREGGKKCLKKDKKDEKKIFFFVVNKYQSMTHVYKYIFQGLFKNIVFRSVALVTKNVWAILDIFFTDLTFFRPINYYSLKVTKFNGDIVSKIRVIKQITTGGRQTPACSGLK